MSGRIFEFSTLGRLTTVSRRQHENFGLHQKHSKILHTALLSMASGAGLNQRYNDFHCCYRWSLILHYINIPAFPIAASKCLLVLRCNNKTTYQTTTSIDGFGIWYCTTLPCIAQHGIALYRTEQHHILLHRAILHRTAQNSAEQ